MCLHLSGSPENVFTARLVGGAMDGTRIEIEPGRETIEWGAPLVAFGGPPEQLEQTTSVQSFGLKASATNPRRQQSSSPRTSIISTSTPAMMDPNHQPPQASEHHAGHGRDASASSCCSSGVRQGLH